MWQKLYTELQDKNFVVITVAMESRGASSAGGPIRKSKATHPSLIDEDHLVADLYNMLNVPQAVWIDEEGRIVRPTEVPGAALSFNLRKYLRKATELSPDSWNFLRQMKNLQHILGPGGPEFMSRVRKASKAGKTCYPRPDMVSMGRLG